MKADIELVQQVMEGDTSAYSELVQRHQRPLFRVILRFTRDSDVAEDVLQDAFIKAYQKIGQFEGRSSFKSWLYRIAINTAKNHLRTGERDSLNIDDVQVSKNAAAESALLRQAVEKRLQDEVEALPLKQKTAVLLRVYEDLSFKEIAEIMDCPYDTAKANYRHGLMKLKASMLGDELLTHWLKFNDEEAHVEESNNNKVKIDH